MCIPPIFISPKKFIELYTQIICYILRLLRLFLYILYRYIMYEYVMHLTIYFVKFYLTFCSLPFSIYFIHLLIQMVYRWKAKFTCVFVSVLKRHCLLSAYTYPSLTYFTSHFFFISYIDISKRQTHILHVFSKYYVQWKLPCAISYR